MASLLELFGLKLVSPKHQAHRNSIERMELGAEIDANRDSLFGARYNWTKKENKIYEIKTTSSEEDKFDVIRKQDILARIRHDPRGFCMDEEMRDAYAKQDGMLLDTELNVILPNEAFGNDEVFRAYFKDGKMHYWAWRNERANEWSQPQKLKAYDSGDGNGFERLAHLFFWGEKDFAKLVKNSNLPRDYKAAVRELWKEKKSFKLL